ncbi:hypothetical protein GCM10011519_34500 [Marmoricola endophyticus]|uniref:DUF3618 domain-containing protein n=1 Tax=Marmoricola endophyticus TaxID=2040280 RepID=A0A917BUB5_9ACTN|nr:DUF3618 domain-containing protein [Marmoricola endophyticus]GGF57695.1 hypothetical protein GCM10011519_34500 [Marmoricola endophyticus]
MAAQDRQSIEDEMEVARRELAASIDQLLHRSSPKTIANRQVAAIKGFFVDPQSGLRTDNVIKVVAGVGGAIALILVVRKVSG